LGGHAFDNGLMQQNYFNIKAKRSSIFGYADINNYLFLKGFAANWLINKSQVAGALAQGNAHFLA
jgi:hypothetical protein